MPLAILVVAHEVGIRLLLSAVLEDMGYHVLTAENTHAAVGIVENQPVQLIVTDIQTPTVDGRDFLGMLADRGYSIPLVVMASSFSAEIAQKVGAVGHVDKHFTVLQARATIRAALQGTGAATQTTVKSEHERPLRVFVSTGQRFLAEMITMTLNHGVYVTRSGLDPTEAAAIIRDWRPQLIVADLDGEGGELLHQIGLERAAGALPIPIVAVTRTRALRTILAAFEQGADDVLTVPISPEELLARVLALTRRTYGQTFPLRPTLLLGALEIDIVNNRVRLGSSEVSLTPNEQSLLYLLAANVGEWVSGEEILMAVWGVDYAAQNNIWGVDYAAENDLVEHLVVELAAKLQRGRTVPRFIAAFPGVGYRFLPVTE